MTPGKLSRAILAASSIAGSASLFTAPAATALISGDHYEDNLTGTCTAGSDCVLRFSPIPSGKAVVIDSVACSFQVGGQYMQRASISVGERTMYLTLHLDYDLGGTAFKFYTGNTNSKLRITAGQRPFIRTTLGVSTLQFVECHVSGTVRPL